MELKDILTLMEAFNASGLNRMQYQCAAETLTLEKGAVQSHPQTISVQPTMPAVVAPVPVHHSVEQPAVETSLIPEAMSAGDIVTAPMVGVFYPAPSPEAAPYVLVGQSVVKGQTLCILEAMKVLNEIQTEWDGVVEAVLVQPEDIVEYGQPLYRIRRVG